jgi:methylated-DNA-protein-cysteine methyltransferase-like protein
VKPSSIFSQKVIRLVKKIPRGKVASYGQIAALAGKSHASRGVSWILYSCAEKYELPWHRIVNSKGKISFPSGSPQHMLQTERLMGEGIVFLESGAIQMARFQWKKK